MKLVHTTKSWISNQPINEQKIIEEYLITIDPEEKRSVNVLLRFLYIAELNISRAIELVNIFDDVWSKVDKAASDEDVLRELKTGKYAKGGVDIQGRGVMQIYVKEHIPSDFEVAVMIKTLFLVMDMVLSDIETAKGGLVWVCHMEGSGWNNFNLQLQKEFANLFKVFGSSALKMCGSVNIVDSPWWISGALVLCRPFIGAFSDKIQTHSQESIKASLGSAFVVNESLYEKFRSGNLYRWK